MNDMKLGAIASWMGSKRTLAPKIVHQLGPHSSYWEPFCGSMAVLLSKLPAQSETVNDLHADLVNLARVIKNPVDGSMLWRRLRRVLFCEQLLKDAREVLDQEFFRVDPVIRAENYFLNCWMGMNGLAGTKGGETNKRGIARRYTSNGGAPAKRWESAVSSIPAWRQRMRSVTILCGDGIEMCERIEDKAKTVIYVDSPYFEKSVEYVHDFTMAQHRRLAIALNQFYLTRVVISHYEHPLLQELYPQWSKIDLARSKNLGVTAKEKSIAPEVLLVNGPVF